MMNPNGQKGRTVSFLQNLPTELILDIGDYLSHGDKVCLALTSQWGRWIFGVIPHSNTVSKIELLSQLEERAMWTSEILCRVCKKFHEPQRGLELTSHERTRACNNPDLCWFQRWSFSEYLPCHFHFELLAAVGRSHRLRLEPPVYPPSLLNSVEHFLRDDGQLGCVVEHSVHFSSEGNVILKTEKIVRPGFYLPLTMEKTRALKEAFDEQPYIGDICSHAQWSEIYPFIFDKELGYLCWNDEQWSFGPRKRHSLRPMSALRKCLWTHKEDCTSYCKAQKRLWYSLEGRMFSCGACATDSTMNTIRMKTLPDEANFLVLTSWKDLGQCKDKLETQWQQHLEAYNSQERGHRVLGSVAEKVDVVVKMEKTEMGNGPTYYYPAVSEEGILKLFLSEDEIGNGYVN